MISQCEHLGEIAHGGLRHVRLPVCIRGEGDRRVERQIGCHVGKMLRIEWKPVLKALDSISEEHRHEAEEEHRDRILGPLHLVAFIDARELVQGSLYWPKNHIYDGLFPLEDAGHVETDRLCAHQYKREEEENLKPAIGGHVEGCPVKNVRVAVERRRDKREG